MRPILSRSPHPRKRQERLFWADTEVIAVPACDCGARWHAAVISVDLTERRFAEQVLHRLAFSDPLTGLANRVVLEDRLAQAIAQNARRGTPSQLFYFDLDRFKPVNDRLGHEAGDDILRQVAVRLGSVFRPGDTIARVGGDEFAVLAEGATADTDLLKRAQKAVESPFNIKTASGNEKIEVGLSGGQTPANGQSSVKQTLHLADRAMYKNKRRRRNGRGAQPKERSCNLRHVRRAGIHGDCGLPGCSGVGCGNQPA